MAYSDYGGYGYRNGERIVERSDAVLTPEGLKSTPGAWPGWTLLEGRNGDSYHVILGDGPIFVCLYKQQWFEVYRLRDRLDICGLVEDPLEEYFENYTDSNGNRYIKNQYFIDSGKPLVLNVDGHRIEFFFTEEDNFYQYVKMTQPDGTIWTGFSGDGVGAGLEDAGYGYDTSDREFELNRIFLE